MRKTTIGGQALLEGLMMIGPRDIAIAIRKPDGEILVEKRPGVPKTIPSKIPVVRGAYNLFRQMVVGIKALMFSADFIELEEGEEEKPSKIDAFIEKLFGDKFKDAVIYFAVILGLALSIGLFILLPNLLAGFFKFDTSTNQGVIIYNLIEGLFRIVIFFLYLYFASMMKEMKRVWQYHGAEHKTIHCYENEEELTVENVRKFSTKHPRCGTSFMFLVMILSILMFSFLGWHSIIVNILLRLLLIPLVAGIAFELLKFSGRHIDNPLVKLITLPGMLFQYLTTKEPDDLQIEVAIAAMNAVLVDDKEADKW